MSEGYLGLFVAAAVAQIVCALVAVHDWWRRVGVKAKPPRDDKQA